MTGLLLDTHAALFWWAGSARPSGAARDAIADENAFVWVSAATAWEVAAKCRLGKLDLAGDPLVHVPRSMARNDVQPLPVAGEHGLRAGSLPGDPGDAFDRVIAARALVEDLTVVTRDSEIAAFGCKVLW